MSNVFKPVPALARALAAAARSRAGPRRLYEWAPQECYGAGVYIHDVYMFQIN